MDSIEHDGVTGYFVMLAYNDEERRSKKNTLLSYIVKYNERHEDEIRYNRPEPISATFYRREKKEVIDPIDVNVDDTIQLSLEPNLIGQTTSTKGSPDVCIGSTCRIIPLQKKIFN